MPDSESIENIIATYLSQIPETVERVEVAFFGGSFTAIDRDLQRYYLESVRDSEYYDRISGIRLSTRPDCIDDEIVSMLLSYGVETVELGVQSFSDKVLELSGRGHSAEDVDKAMEVLKQNKLRTGIQLMPGLPGDNDDSVIYSAQRTAALAPDDVRIYPTVVLRDTELADMYEKGMFIPFSLEKAVKLSSILYDMFLENGINVIRMGIHPMEMSEDSVIAGPYHTSFGFLVKSRSRLNSLIEKISDDKRSADATGIELFFPSKCAEEYIGMRKNNISLLKKHFGFRGIKYSISDMREPLFSFFY